MAPKKIKVEQSRILGVGYYVPERVVKNQELSTLMDTSDDWIQQRTGIRQRYFLEEGKDNSDMAKEASLKAIKSAGIQKEEIDYIIFATLSPEHDFPGTGCFLQAKLGLVGVPSLDIRVQCTGFIYGLELADSLIKAGRYKKILVVGSEVHSRGLDLTTEGREVSVLFGDGAGAAVVGASENTERGILASCTFADGQYAKELWVPAPGSHFHPQRLSKEMIDEKLVYPKMNGKTVFVHAVRKMPEALLTVVEEAGLKISDIDLLVPHQANLRINLAVAEALQIPKEKVFNTIDRFGNTTAATLPIGLSEAVTQGVLKEGMLVGMVAFGSGFTWGACLMRW